MCGPTRLSIDCSTIKCLAPQSCIEVSYRHVDPAPPIDSYLHRVHERVPSQMRIDKANTSPYPLQRKPQHQIFRAIWPVQRNHLIPLYAQPIDQPIAHPLQIRKELPIRPRPAIVVEEGAVGSILCVLFEAVVEEELVFCFSFSDELLRGGCGVVERSGLQVVPDVIFGVEVGRGGGGGAC